jgi:hypothetical protein
MSGAQRPMGNSLVQSGSSLGAIIMPLVVRLLLNAGHGWRIPFAVTGGETLWQVLSSRRFLSWW